MNSIVPVIGVVYKSKDGNWRGFCHPYDVTCNAETKDEAMKILMELIGAYEESLERHNNPKHLILKKLSDNEDRVVFKKVWPAVSQRMASELRRATTPTKYSDYLSQDRNFKVNHNSVSYSHRSLSMAA